MIMEEEKRKAIDLKRPRMLDFNAPLLSTRRPSGYTSEPTCCTIPQNKFQDTGDRIPFCWEQVPGKPKDSERSDSIRDGDTPRLRLPPSRWHPRKEVASNDDLHVHVHDLNQDDGCDADIEEDYYNNEDVFSDAMDVLSLTEAIDIVERAEQSHGLDGFNLESLGPNETISPSYIIERFLPDATALAASSSSVLDLPENLSRKLPYVCNHQEACVTQAVRQSCSMPKGCGLEIFLPWRMKHRICGVKSPIRQVSAANINLQSQSQSSSDKIKRSIVKPFGDHVKKHTGCISHST